MTSTERKRNKALADEIRAWLLDHDMWIDTNIYFNGKCYSTEDPEAHKHYYNDPKHLVEYEDDPGMYVEYCNRDTLTMTFEGPLYDLLNYGEYPPGWEEEFNAIFRKHGMFFELGYSWSLVAVEL